MTSSRAKTWIVLLTVELVGLSLIFGGLFAFWRSAYLDGQVTIHKFQGPHVRTDQDGSPQAYLDVWTNKADHARLDGLTVALFSNNCKNHQEDRKVGLHDLIAANSGLKDMTLPDGRVVMRFSTDGERSDHAATFRNLRCVFLKGRRYPFGSSVDSNVLRIGK
jgi:hypothetical protein